MSSIRRLSARVLVTGSRDWPDQKMVWDELDDAYENRFSGAHPFVVVQGMAKGADQMAAAWAHGKRRDGALSIFSEGHPANWRPDGVFVPSAGHQRNKRMVDLGADLVLAFIRNKSAGATGCMRYAMKAGLDVRVLRIDDQEEA